MDTAASEDQYKQLLAVEPGDDVFVDYADLLRRTGRLPEALVVALTGVTHATDHTRGRLLLSRIYYELGLLPLAVVEVKRLQAEHPELRFLKQLLLKLAPDEKVSEAVEESAPTEGAAPAGSNESTLAEGEFDFEGLEELENK